MQARCSSPTHAILVLIVFCSLLKCSYSYNCTTGSAFVWNCEVPGNWSALENWNITKASERGITRAHSLPMSNDCVFINGTTSVVWLDLSAWVQSLKLSGGAILTGNNNSSLIIHTMTVEDTAQLQQVWVNVTDSFTHTQVNDPWAHFFVENNATLIISQPTLYIDQYFTIRDGANVFLKECLFNFVEYNLANIDVYRGSSLHATNLTLVKGFFDIYGGTVYTENFSCSPANSSEFASFGMLGSGVLNVTMGSYVNNCDFHLGFDGMDYGYIVSSGDIVSGFQHTTMVLTESVLRVEGNLQLFYDSIYLDETSSVQVTGGIDIASDVFLDNINMRSTPAVEVVEVVSYASTPICNVLVGLNASISQLDAFPLDPNAIYVFLTLPAQCDYPAVMLNATLLDFPGLGHFESHKNKTAAWLTWHPVCSQETCKNGSCQPNTGACICNPGFTGADCSNSVGRTSAGKIAGIVVGCVAAFVLILLVAVYAIKKARARDYVSF